MSTSNIAESDPKPSTTSKKEVKEVKTLEMQETLDIALRALNDQIIYVYEGSKIAEIHPKRIRNYKIPLIDCYTFKNEAYAPLRVGSKSVPDEWLKWKGRRTAARRVYIPGEERITKDGNLNLWFPSPTLPKPGNIDLFHQYLAGMMENDPKYLDWVIAWIAYHLQYPNKKMLTGVMFWSHEQGNGKSTLGWMCRKLHGEHNSFLLRTKFPERFNSYAENTLFGWIDELAPIKKAGQADDVKSMITQPRILIENKRDRAYEMDDIISYYFTSNYPNALDLTPEDRRFFVHNVGTISLTREWFERTFRPWLEIQTNLNAILHYFLNVDLTKPIIGGNPETLEPAPFDPVKIAPRNDARLQAICDNRDDIEAWLYDLKDNPASILGEGNAHWTIFTSEELFARYQDLTKDTRTGIQAFRLRMSAAMYKLCKGEGIRAIEGRPRLYTTDPAKAKADAPQVKLWLTQERE